MSEKEGIPGKIWEVVISLSDAAQQAAIRKAQELKLELEAGEISFQETLINLSHNRDVLLDAVEKNHIVQMPLKLQNRLLIEATKVKANLEALIGGADTILPIEQSVEDLNATIWQLNLQNLSPEVLSFESKMNDLKAQETKLRKLLADAQKVEEAIQHLSDLQAQAQAALEGVNESVKESKLASESMALSVEKTASAERAALSSASVIQTHQNEIAAAAASVRTISADIAAAKERAGEFLNEIGTLRQAFEGLKTSATDLVTATKAEIETTKSAQDKSFQATTLELRTEVETLVKGTTQRLEDALLLNAKQLKDAVDLGTANLDAAGKEEKAALLARETKAAGQLDKVAADFEQAKNDTLANYKAGFDLLKAGMEGNIEENDTEAKRLNSYLADLEARIHTSLERATGYTLFHSFQKRQIELSRSKYMWAGALLACVCLSVVLSWSFIHSLGASHEFNPLFVMKLSISLPIIFAITFCSVQYSKERRLEEEYAFKSNISVSLEPYQKLVGTLVDQTDPEEKAKYTAFLISSINRVFTSPTGLVFDTDDSGGETANNLLKTAGNVVENVLKTKLK